MLFDMAEWFKLSQIARICLLIWLLFRPSPAQPTSQEVYGLYVDKAYAYWDPATISYRDTYNGFQSPPIIFDDNEFLNRLVGIVHQKAVIGWDAMWVGAKLLSTGIFINEEHVLTSFNPFRRMINVVPRKLMHVHYYKAKWVNFTMGVHVGYILGKEQFACARQVVPLEPKDIMEEQWHGVKHAHSPVHDLMLIKISNKLTFPEEYYEVNNSKWRNAVVIGPQLTELANEHEELPDTIKYVSLGMVNYRSIYDFNHLHVVAIKRHEGIIENCDEWFPRSWGYFICIQNTKNYIAIGSGALLFGNGKVFGVGSFALRKGKKSIFVFTDIRPYRKLINLPCDYNTNSFRTL